jgi:Metallopeptidase toxin 4
VLAIQEIKALRRELADGFKVGLEIVEDNPDLKKKLKDWNIRKVAASFNAIEGKLYIRKSTTAYTVEHEMIHMKLWYKMTREHPEMAGLYKLTLGNDLFHEEYVLAEFMKNPSKWSEADLINDLKVVNKARSELKIDNVSLEYFKTWDFKEQLNKITQ